MDVFVTGATGYVGGTAARALRRAGHRVFGLVRNDAKARALEAQEITPVIGDLADPTTYVGIAARCAVLIHAAFDGQARGIPKDRAAVEGLIEAGRRGAQPKTFIYTSGVWVHGDTRGALVDESSPLDPLPLVTWRPPHESLVLQSDAVRGIVLRPGCVYGGTGGMPAGWFAAAADGMPPEVVGDGANRWALVHVDDLGEAYRLAAECGLEGEVFCVVERSHETVREMAAAAARAAGLSGEVRSLPLVDARKSLGAYSDALAADQRVDGGKAERVLGWRPRHHGFVDEADSFYRAWRASR
ncbi:MAG TPA: NAD-dependent epimerase/dehydratase family protein [Gemmatimonadales bacterium]|jgi:nucleoside-diphosphate-sugar epimerase|nr:NAD-dependent epimerase/dehydratase family protein [Gemmatimonadales bacterium]